MSDKKKNRFPSAFYLRCVVCNDNKFHLHPYFIGLKIKGICLNCFTCQETSGVTTPDPNIYIYDFDDKPQSKEEKAKNDLDSIQEIVLKAQELFNLAACEIEKPHRNIVSHFIVTIAVLANIIVQKGSAYMEGDLEGGK